MCLSIALTIKFAVYSTSLRSLSENVTLISWICWSSPPMSAYVSCGAFSTFITVTRGSVSSIRTPMTAWTCEHTHVTFFYPCVDLKCLPIKNPIFPNLTIIVTVPPMPKIAFVLRGMWERSPQGRIFLVGTFGDFRTKPRINTHTSLNGIAQ